jgi:hypothetical protein
VSQEDGHVYGDWTGKGGGDAHHVAHFLIGKERPADDQFPPDDPIIARPPPKVKAPMRRKVMKRPARERGIPSVRASAGFSLPAVSSPHRTTPLLFQFTDNPEQTVRIVKGWGGHPGMYRSTGRMPENAAGRFGVVRVKSSGNGHRSRPR